MALTSPRYFRRDYCRREWQVFHHRLLTYEQRWSTRAPSLLPVYWIAARDPDATVVVYPSDHFVLEGAAFLAHVAEVVAFVDERLPRAPRTQLAAEAI